MLEKLERELMLVARCNLLTPRDRKGQAGQPGNQSGNQPGDQTAQTQTGQTQTDRTAQTQTDQTDRTAQSGQTDQTGQCSGAGEARLDRSAYFLLSSLETEGALSIGQLADALGLDVSTVNRQTGALLRAGLLERIPDPKGGLARKLRATTLGAERLAADRERRRAKLERVLAGWTPDEVRRFEDALTRFNREVEADEGRTWPRPENAQDA
ncbi:MarR family transcriptional regulator [Streptomyces sp. NBS 14/10]|uniref:MarR family winged helix-turn-helix transcriptional regulator n=1 Tax=Streptomyces sp. NBS 14/10 TaxID=1945643 RepID=UPI000B7E8D2F|nr:MarR family transcriptional regulator [Streptomyces sp. NBS 14/10]KAK1182126.1 MarR family transcriptional regulator [Streptomyces sp. NBS 14/10]